MPAQFALIAAVVLALGTIRALVRGDAAAGEGISRQDDPLAYWFIVSLTSAAAILLAIVGLRA